MKTLDIVPGDLSDCFVRTLPSFCSSSSASSTNCNGDELIVTKLDVLKYVQYLRSSTKFSSQKIYSVVTNHVEKLGIRASTNCVIRRVKNLDNELKDIVKFPSKTHPKCVQFIEKLDEKFVVQSRKQGQSNIVEQEQMQAQEEERSDQTPVSSQHLNIPETPPVLTRTRPTNTELRTPSETSASCSTMADPFNFPDESSMESMASNDEEYFPPKKKPRNEGKYNIAKIPDVIEAAARYDFSLRATSVSSTTTLFNHGCAEPVTVKKIRSSTQKYAKQAVDSLKGHKIRAIWFDGKKDKRTAALKNGKKIEVERSHYTIVDQTNDKYLGFFPINDKGTGVNLATGILDYLDERGIDYSDLQVIGADSTLANTGHKDGAIKHLERMLHRPLMWDICLLHQVELPLRHKFFKEDGPTSSNNTFTGPIGKKIESSVWELGIGNYKKIYVPNFPVLDKKVLQTMSSDARILYRLVYAVTTGKDVERVRDAVIGEVEMARWITLASRILRLYMSVPEEPYAPNLYRMVYYIVHVYYKMYAAIKRDESLEKGAVHLYDEIRNIIDQISKGEQDLVLRYVAWNAYMAHPENIILAMIGDKDAAVREEGVNLILEIRRRLRQDPSPPRGIRTFYVPEINFKAAHYSKMVEFQRPFGDYGHIYFQPSKVEGRFSVDIVSKLAKVTEPPLTRYLSLAEIRDFKETPFSSEHFKCHSQPCERGVANTSASVTKKTDYLQQLGRALLRVKAHNSLFTTVVRKQLFPGFSKVPKSYKYI